MYYDLEDERDPFEAFGEPEPANDIAIEEDTFETEDARDAHPVIEPQEPAKVKTGFSWAGFMGGLAALVWIGGAIGGPLSYYGIDAVMAMDPAMQAGLFALAFGPALLFWVAASAAGESLKARKLAAELTRLAQNPRLATDGVENDAQRLTNSVKHEIENLNDAVATALDRLAELERSAQRNAALFGEAIAASRENVDTMTAALQQERDAIVQLNGELGGQTENMAHSIGRQIRLMREASKMVKTEIVSAENALQSYVSSFDATATTLGDRTAQIHDAADGAAAATASLNGTLANMLEGLSEATRLTDAAKKSTEQAVIAANETASAVRETTRTAVFEAKRAAQLIRAENQAMQEAAADTLSKLQEAASAARAASVESEAAADRYTAKIEQRLSALAATAGAKKAPASVAERPAPRVVERTVERAVERVVDLDASPLQAAASAAVARGGVRMAEEARRPLFKGWGTFTPLRNEPPKAANEESDAFDLADFGASPNNPDAALKNGALDLVAEAGVDLDTVLQPGDLDRIAQSSRNGASARRHTVADLAPTAVTRIARHVKRDLDAKALAAEFRARPDLAKSTHKGEGSDLVRAYLLIDAALAS
ncbi:MAG: hypothetical protein J0L81_18520 [Caulobacterales bacterium]|jgi:hypothetical protein|nr:hypothetical protein [Caulobacterales bacterium]